MNQICVFQIFVYSKFLNYSRRPEAQLKSLNVESGREGKKTKLLCEAKKYHFKILVFFFSSAAESCFFCLFPQCSSAQGLLCGNKFNNTDSAKLQAKQQLFPAGEQSFIIQSLHYFFITLAKLTIKSLKFIHQFRIYIYIVRFER